jgi:hypothetical protein
MAEEKKLKVPQINWNRSQEKTLMETCIDQPSTADNGFKQSEWDKIRTLFNDATGLNYSKDQLQSKFSELKKKYKAFTSCKDNSGFGFDKDKMVPTAPDEVWKKWLEIHPDHKKFRTEEVINYDVMDKLFNGKVAKGTFAAASTACSIPLIHTPRNISSTYSRK